MLYADWYLKKNTGNYASPLADAQDYVEQNLQGNYSQELLDRLTVENDGKVTIAPKTQTPNLTRVEGVVIPTGFEHVAGTTVSTGLVIKDISSNANTNGNEFVWVPVAAGTFESDGFGTDLTGYSEPYETAEYTTERDEYDAMVSSVNTYGGFYIGRYEASETSQGSGIAQSKSGVFPWNRIGAGNIDPMLAPGYARAVYPDSEDLTIGDPVSTLPYGVQWDATVKFIAPNYEGILTDSQNYGNYATNMMTGGSIIETGSNPSYKLNNIYDMAGNVQECTMEYKLINGNINRIARGGHFMNQGGGDHSYPVTKRYGDLSESYSGFRIALYIKE